MRSRLEQIVNLEENTVRESFDLNSACTSDTVSIVVVIIVVDDDG